MLHTKDVPRLAVYGSLAPGERHHGQIADLSGNWQAASVKGSIADRGWGSRIGYPGFVPDPLGGDVAVMVLTSPELATAWERLDEFEGSEYRRIVVPATMESGEVAPVAIYALQEESAAG